MRVLIAVDGSKPCDELVKDLAARPWNGSDEFMVLHVVSTPDTNEWQDYGLSVWPELKQKMLAAANDLVESKLNYLRSQMSPTITITSKVAEGHVCDSIVQEAKDWHADLIVLAARGHSALERFFLGTVADGVLKKTSCSVEVFKTRRSSRANHQNLERALESA